MKCWDCNKHDFVETPTEMVAFLEDIAEVYKKHGLFLSHEDLHGSFLVEKFYSDDIEWLMCAMKNY